MKLSVSVSGFSGMVFLIWFLMMWISGAVFAKGAGAVWLCIFFFPYSFYVVLERLFTLWGLL